MTERINFADLSPRGYAAVNRLHSYVESQLDPVLMNLVYVRASQLNGCAYCTDQHSADLSKADGEVRRVFSVAVWRESPFYTPRERAALALTEGVTLMPQGFDADLITAAREFFDDAELADLVIAIGAINLWNALGVTGLPEPAALETQPGVSSPAAPTT